MRVKAQQGAAAVEFALVFTVFFGMLWAILAYAIPFFLLQVMNHATHEASRFALRADPGQGSVIYHSTLVSLAQQRLSEEITWLPVAFSAPLQATTQVVDTATQPRLLVRLTYPNYTSNPIIPTLNLPVIGTIPQLSQDLKAESRVLLEPSS